MIKIADRPPVKVPFPNWYEEDSKTLRALFRDLAEKIRIMEIKLEEIQRMVKTWG